MELETTYLLLTEPKQFKIWLESKSNNAVIGRKEAAAFCPLANFLYSRGLETEVCYDYIAIYNFDNQDLLTKVPLSQIGNWISKFLENIDKTDSIDITAATALEALRSIN